MYTKKPVKFRSSQQCNTEYILWQALNSYRGIWDLRKCHHKRINRWYMHTDSYRTGNTKNIICLWWCLHNYISWNFIPFLFNYQLHYTVMSYYYNINALNSICFFCNTYVGYCCTKFYKLNKTFNCFQSNLFIFCLQL